MNFPREFFSYSFNMWSLGYRAQVALFLLSRLHTCRCTVRHNSFFIILRAPKVSERANSARRVDTQLSTNGLLRRHRPVLYFPTNSAHLNGRGCESPTKCQPSASERDLAKEKGNSPTIHRWSCGGTLFALLKGAYI